jgi:hypothetical protein
MEKKFPQWFAGPGRQSIYAVLSPGEWVEHQKFGSKYRVFNLVAEIYPQRLRIADLLADTSGAFIPLCREEYDQMRMDFESLELLK